MQLRLLGVPQVSLDGQPALRSMPRKALALLYYLAVTRQTHSRSYLAGLLWGDLPESAARSNLRKILSNLRQALGTWLNIDRYHVAFNINCNYWVDVEAFEAGVGDASLMTDAGQLEQAVELYRGDFLAGFYVLNAPDFDAWMIAQQVRLRELLIQALYTLAFSYTEWDELPRCITYGRRLLALEPWSEEFHRKLMQLLAHAGQRNAALAQYELCRQVLAEELGVEPMAETKALYERILNAKPIAPDHEQISPPMPANGDFTAKDLASLPSTPHQNLPVQLAPLIGRETELSELSQLLSDPALQLVTITGPGGIGKTHLALEIAQTQVVHFPHGVYFVPLAPITSPDSIVPTIAKAINFSFYENRTPQQQLFDYLRRKQMLLVLDNFEHLLAGTNLILEMLVSAPGLKILITSRNRLNVQAEQIYPIAGVEVPQHPVSPELAANFSGIKLFLQRGRRAQPGFKLVADNIEHVIQICRWVDGMPLGILLAAAWLELLTPAEIAKEIRLSLDFLAADMHDLPDRQQSLRAVFDHSWRLLNEQERKVFKRLSVFQGGFDHHAAQAVTGASFKELRALVSKSMLDRTLFGRFELHSLLQQYGMEKLGEDPTLEETTHYRHSAYYCTILQQREFDLKGARQQIALAGLEANAENLRSAWEWAVEQAGVYQLDPALESLCLFYTWRGRYFEGETACQMAAEKLVTLSTPDSQRLLSRVLAWQSAFSQILGHTERTAQLVQMSQTLLESPDLKGQDTRSEEAFIFLQSGQILIYADRVEAKRLFMKSLDLYRSLDDPWGMANALDRLAEIFRLSADYDQSNRLQQESLAIRRSLGDQKGIFSALSVLAFNAMFQENFEEIECRRREIQALLPTLKDRLSFADGAFTTGRALYFAGQFAESRSWLEESLAAYEEMGLRTRDSLLSLGWLCLAMIELGEYEQAFLQAREMLFQGRKVGDQDIEAFALWISGMVELAWEDYAEAQQLLQHSLDIYQILGQHKDAGKVLSILGRAAYGLGDVPKALQCLAEALRIGLRIRVPVVLRFALPLCTLILVDSGNHARAVELYIFILQDLMIRNSRWVEDAFGRQISSATANLPPATLAAARQRGEAGDIWEIAAELLVQIERGKLS